MSLPARLLGFAFANADFLFEVDRSGTVIFAAGAAKDLVEESAETLIGKPAAALFRAPDAAKFNTLANGLSQGKRVGPFDLELASGANADVSMFSLAENGANISCTLARRKSAQAAPAKDEETGLQSRDAFLKKAGDAGAGEALTLLDVPALSGLCATLPPEKSHHLLRQIGESLAASGATAAGRISESSFGALAPATLGDLGLSQRIADVFAGADLPAPKINQARLSLEGADLSPEQRLLSLRYAIDQFTEKKRFGGEAGDLGAMFAEIVTDTQKRLNETMRTLGAGAFALAYQPICDLKTGKVSHYEALARFDNPEGTGATVKFIEAMGVVDSFDLAVANKILSVLEERPDAHIAFNISGATIDSPSSFGLLAGILAKRRKLAPRALIEITETATIQDLAAAGMAVAALRAMGYRVGLDDFGAGAASINYLHAFPVDFVKFDGAMIAKIGQSKRDDALLAGMAKLCGELGVITIAEWIENEAMAKQALALGFDDGQGKFLGAPLTEIPRAQTPVGKRKGVTTSWG